MNIKDFIKDNPYRVMGVFTNDSSNILSANNSRMKAYATIGKSVQLPKDLPNIFGDSPNRRPESLMASMAALSSPQSRLLGGLFWFMNLTATDAKALEALAQGGSLLESRRIWESSEQNMSALQNQLVCSLLMDPRSYSRALQLASTLYEEFGQQLITTLTNGFDLITPDQLMTTFLTEILTASDGDCASWDKAVKRLADTSQARSHRRFTHLNAIQPQWTQVKANRHIKLLQDALNVAKTTEIHSTQDNFDIAHQLMSHAQPHLKKLEELWRQHPSTLLSRYATIADTVCEEILEREITYYNHIGFFPGKTKQVLTLLRFCYRHAATIRLKDRCRLNINRTLWRKEDAPLFPNGTPDDLLLESERKKRNATLAAILSALSEHTPTAA